MARSSPLWPSAPGAILRYAVAVLAVAAAAVAGLLLDRFLQTVPFVSLFLCAILFAAWLGGAGPGLLATGLSILAFYYYFIPATDSLVAQDIPPPRPFCHDGAFRGLGQRRAKAYGGIAATRARRFAGDRSRARKPQQIAAS